MIGSEAIAFILTFVKTWEMRKLFWKLSKHYSIGLILLQNGEFFFWLSIKLSKSNIIGVLYFMWEIISSCSYMSYNAITEY